MFIIIQVKAQDNTFENDFDAHIAFADSICQVGNILICEEGFEEALIQIRLALDIYTARYKMNS